MTVVSIDRPRRAEWTGSPHAVEIHRIRGEVSQLLAQWKLCGEVIEDAVLVVAELLANVVEHARTPFRVSVELRGRLLRVAVDDDADGPAVVRASTATAWPVSGLRVVNAVALRWGWRRRDVGKTVWAEFVV